MTKKRSVQVIFLFCVIILSIFWYKNSKETEAKAANYERYNDDTHIKAARKISELEGVIESAVISCDGKILVGIRVFDNAENSQIQSSASYILEKFFRQDNEIHIETGNDNAKKIIELSLYLETDMNKKVLRQRFDF